jgi:hypothetical protein
MASDFKMIRIRKDAHQRAKALAAWTRTGLKDYVSDVILKQKFVTELKGRKTRR